jgi:small subunit ribosomal protein S17
MADETPENQAAEAEATEAEAATEAAPEATAPEPEPQLPPKEARRRARQRQTTSRRPSTPEERKALRATKAAARRRRREQEKTRAREAGAERTPAQGTPAAEAHVGNPQVRTGTVVSDKADKTITVRIEIVRRHRRYGKVIRSTATMHAHDERNDANQGDLVRVVESRPLSRTKRWRLVEVLERAK